MKINVIKNYNNLSNVPANNSSPSKKLGQKNISVNLSDSPIAYYNKMRISFMGLESKKNISKHDEDHYVGCILGGAIGDAFGAKIEAWSYESIRKTFGDNGLRSLLTKNGVAKITDDTQMTLFTMFALIKNKLYNKGKIDFDSCLKELKSAYNDWNLTQNKNYYSGDKNSILLQDDRLFAKRAPGITCLKATSSDNFGTIENPMNDSKANGALMRSAPFGLILAEEPDKAYDLAMNAAALTHGNPIAYISAGALAYLIANLINGNNLEEAVSLTVNKLKSCGQEGEQISGKIEEAVKLSKENLQDNEAIKQLGLGFLADEALAISIYSALKYQTNFKSAIISSVNHDGDSDTTGSITGNILGVYLGENSLGAAKNKIEIQDIIKEMSLDLYKPITEITNPEKKYGCSINLTTIEERREGDNFAPTESKKTFTSAELARLASLPLVEAVEYRQKLIKKHLGLISDSSDN